MPNNTKNSRSKDNSLSNYKNIAICSAIGTIMFFMLIALFSFVSLKSDLLSKSLYIPIGFFSAAASGIVSGFLTVRKNKKNGALFGALTGLIQGVVSSVICLFINNRSSGSLIFILAAVFVVFGAIGGISAVNVKVRKKYK